MTLIYKELDAAKLEVCKSRLIQMQVSILRKRRLLDGHFNHDLLLNMQTENGHYIYLYDIQDILHDDYVRKVAQRYEHILQYDAQHRDKNSLLLSEFKLILLMLVIFILLVITIASIIKNANYKGCNPCGSIMSMLKP